MTILAAYSRYLMQSACSTQVITFTTNGASPLSEEDKRLQPYSITRLLHYGSTTYWVKQFTGSIQ